jgi:hypothetical protein
MINFFFLKKILEYISSIGIYLRNKKKIKDCLKPKMDTE